MLELVIRILTAGFLGLLVGMINRSAYNSPFTRLFAIICMASCLLTITSIEFFKFIELPWISDPGRISAQVISALGFLGTGLIWIGKDNKVRGLSAGAALWVTAILGMLVGSGLNRIAIISFIFLIIIYCLSNRVADWKHKKNVSNQGNDSSDLLT